MIVVLIILAILIILILSPIYNKQVYYFIFCNKEWKQWNYFIKNADKFEFVEEFDGILYFKFENYKAIIWENGLTSIHSDVQCLLCTYFESKSRKMTKLLEYNIPIDIDYNFKL